MKICLLAAVFAVAFSSPALADWRYLQGTDAMTGKTIEYGLLESTNTLTLDFPYKGHNPATLQVRKHPKYGLDVIYRIAKGQLMCSSITGCPIEVRFDDRAAMRFTGSEPADHDPSTLFINNAPRFIAEARKAKRILVRVNVYQNGAPVMEFHSSQPLYWPGTPAKKKAP